jgi:ATP-binding cassette subfamily B (MDR/TAP) protein 1
MPSSSLSTTEGMKNFGSHVETKELTVSSSSNNILTKSNSNEEKKDEKKKSYKPVYTKLNYDGLNEGEINILKRQIEMPEPSVSYFTLFKFASTFDCILIFIACISAIASGAAMPLFTLIFGNLTQIFNDFIVNGSSPDEFQRSVDHNTLYFVYLGVGVGVTTYIHTFLNADRGEVIAARFRKRYLKAVLRQNIGYFDHIGAGEVTSRVTTDITLIQDGISEKIGITFSGFATFISAFVISFIKSWKLTLILLSCVAVMLFNIGITTYFLIKCITRITAIIGEASTVAEDVLSSIRNTVAFGVQQRLAEKFDAKLEVAKSYGVRKGIIIAIMVSVIWFVAYTTYSLAFWEGSRLIASGQIGVGALMTTVTSVMIGTFALANVAPGVEAMGASVGAAYKIFEAINRVPVIDSEQDDGEQPSEFVGRIQFQNVKFAYPSRPNVPVLDDFNLTIEPGQTVALVGASGSGKSTIIGLLERFYAPIGGTITIDGYKLESLNVKWLRRQLSLVSQEPVLFSCSIYKNIAYGLIGTPYENANEETKSEMIRQACEESNAWEFIKNLTDGLNTEVGERGFLLSGGQKQRIAIARAIVSKPKLLLLDEATSALDTKSEGIVQEALDRVLKSRTTIVIAHRLSTIRDADNIVVMSNGKIIETGAHNDLLARQGAYYLLVQAQNIRAANEKNLSALSNEDSKEQKELQKIDTRATQGSISSLVVKDLERDNYYEPKVITRSTFTLIKSVCAFFFFYFSFFIPLTNKLKKLAITFCP